MEQSIEYANFAAGTEELVNEIVKDHLGWATSIAKSVARAWNLDWQLDGLDGGAYEALLFCARRYDPARGVPFRGYARKRIHEASTQEARNSKSWQKGTGLASDAEQESREISAKLFDMFPELREGFLPSTEEEEGSWSVRTSIRQMLAGATMLATFHQARLTSPEMALEFKELLTTISELEPIHQHILWSLYYEGFSMRSLAEKWEIDDLSIIREHKVILDYLAERIEGGQSKRKILKIRRGLRPIAQKFRRGGEKSPFAKFAESFVLALIVLQVLAEKAKALLQIV